MDTSGAHERESGSKNVTTQPREIINPAQGLVTSTPRHKQSASSLTACSGNHSLHPTPSLSLSKPRHHEQPPSPRTPRMVHPRHSQPSNSRSASRMQQEKYESSQRLHTPQSPQLPAATLRRTQNVMKQPDRSIPIPRSASPSMLSSPFLSGLVAMQGKQQLEQQQQQHLSEQQMLPSTDDVPSWTSASAWSLRDAPSGTTSPRGVTPRGSGKPSAASAAATAAAAAASAVSAAAASAASAAALVMDPSLQQLLQEVENFNMSSSTSLALKCLNAAQLKILWAKASQRLEHLPTAVCSTSSGDSLLMPLPGPKGIAGYKVNSRGQVYASHGMGRFMKMMPQELEAQEQLAVAALRASIVDQLLMLNNNKDVSGGDELQGHDRGTAVSAAAVATSLSKGSKSLRAGRLSGMSHMPSMRDREALARSLSRGRESPSYMSRQSKVQQILAELEASRISDEEMKLFKPYFGSDSDSDGGDTLFDRSSGAGSVNGTAATPDQHTATQSRVTSPKPVRGRAQRTQSGVRWDSVLALGPTGHGRNMPALSGNLALTSALSEPRVGALQLGAPSPSVSMISMTTMDKQSVASDNCSSVGDSFTDEDEEVYQEDGIGEQALQRVQRGLAVARRRLGLSKIPEVKESFKQIVARLEEARVWLKGFTTAELDDKEQRKAMAQMTPRSGLGSGFTDAYDRDADSTRPTDAAFLMKLVNQWLKGTDFVDSQVLDLINAKAGMLPSAFKPLTAEQIAFLAKEDEDVRVTEEQVQRRLALTVATGEGVLDLCMGPPLRKGDFAPVFLALRNAATTTAGPIPLPSPKSQRQSPSPPETLTRSNSLTPASAMKARTASSGLAMPASADLHHANQHPHFPSPFAMPPPKPHIINTIRANGDVLSESGLEGLVELLQRTPAITDIDVSHNSGLGPTAGKILAQMLSPVHKTYTQTSARGMGSTIGGAGGSGLNSGMNSGATSGAGTPVPVSPRHVPCCLVHIDLSGCPIRDAGCASLLSSLIHNNKLHTLWLRGCSLEDAALVPMGTLHPPHPVTSAAAVAGSAATAGPGTKQLVRTTSRVVTLRPPPPPPSFFSTNSSVTTLLLGYNHFTAAGIGAMCKDLALNSTLTTLDLTCCACNDAAVAPLGDLLGSPSASLRVLRLGGNAIGWKGAQALARGLAENTSLQNLVLDDNRLGHAGVLALLEAVKGNTTLAPISITNCFLGHNSGAPPTYNPIHPNGKYSLDLSSPVDREVAVALVNLWVTSGGASWVGCRFQKVAFHMSEALHWPKMLPLEGFLEVMVRNALTLDPALYQPCLITPPLLSTLAAAMACLDNSEVWKMSLLTIATKVGCVTASQVAILLRGFSNRKEKVDAAAVLLSACINPDKLHRELRTNGYFSEDDILTLQQQLRFDLLLPQRQPLLPGWEGCCSGAFSLDMGRVLHRFMAIRLVELAVAQTPGSGSSSISLAAAAQQQLSDASNGNPIHTVAIDAPLPSMEPVVSAVARVGDRCACMRNITHGGISLDNQAAEISSHSLPLAGILTLDFINLLARLNHPRPPTHHASFSSATPGIPSSRPQSSTLARQASMNVRAKLNVTAVSAKAVPYSVGGGGGNLQQQSLMSAAQMGAFLATEPPWAGILCWRHADIAWEGLFKRAVVGLKLDPTDLRLCFWRQGQKMWKPPIYFIQSESLSQHMIARQQAYGKQIHDVEAAAAAAAAKLLVGKKGKGGAPKAPKKAKKGGVAGPPVDPFKHLIEAATKETHMLMPLLAQHATQHAMTCFQVVLLLRLLPDVTTRVQMLVAMWPAITDRGNICDVIFDLDHAMILPPPPPPPPPVVTGAVPLGTAGSEAVAGVVVEAVAVGGEGGLAPSASAVSDSTAPSKQASVMSEKAGGKTRAPSPLGSAAQGSVLEVVFENSPPPLGIVVPDLTLPSKLLTTVASKIGYSQLYLPWARASTLDGTTLFLDLACIEQVQLLCRLCTWAQRTQPFDLVLAAREHAEIAAAESILVQAAAKGYSKSRHGMPGGADWEEGKNGEDDDEKSSESSDGIDELDPRYLAVGGAVWRTWGPSPTLIGTEASRLALEGAASVSSGGGVPGSTSSFMMGRGQSSKVILPSAPSASSVVHGGVGTRLGRDASRATLLQPPPMTSSQGGAARQPSSLQLASGGLNVRSESPKPGVQWDETVKDREGLDSEGCSSSATPTSTTAANSDLHGALWKAANSSSEMSAASNPMHSSAVKLPYMDEDCDEDADAVLSCFAVDRVRMKMQVPWLRRDVHGVAQNALLRDVREDSDSTPLSLAQPSFLEQALSHVKRVSINPPTAIITLQLCVTNEQQQHVAAVMLQCLWRGLQQRRMIAHQIKADAANRWQAAWRRYKYHRRLERLGSLAVDLEIMRVQAFLVVQPPPMEVEPVPNEEEGQEVEVKEEEE